MRLEVRVARAARSPPTLLRAAGGVTMSAADEIEFAPGLDFHEPEPDATGDEADEPEPEPFVGLSHAEVLDLRFDGAPPELIEDLFPRGVLAVVAGLPEAYKGWVCAK